jgi:hypothetical protein
MDHADIAIIDGRGWAVGAWTILVMAVILGLASDQTSQLIDSYFSFGASSVVSTARVAVTPSTYAIARHGEVPIVLTIPLAVTRTQRMMVARLKHHRDFAHRSAGLRGELKSAQGLLAGLALLGASQMHSH